MDSGKQRKKTPWLVVILLVLLLALAGAGAVFLNSHLFISGKLISTDVTQLDLSGRELGSLMSLKRCKALKSLDLRGCEVSGEELAQLQAALPECVIRYDVTVGGERYDIDTAELTLPDLPANWEELTKLPSLRLLTVERCTNPAAMPELQKRLPDCEMRWRLGLGGEWFDVNTEDIALTAAALSSEELLSQLKWFPTVKTVTVENAVLTPDEQRALRDAFTDIAFRWPVTAGSQLLSWDVTELTFAGQTAEDLTALEEVLDLLPSLRKLDFTGSEVPGADRLAFMERHPEIEAAWTVSLLGETYPWNTQLLDFSGRTFDQDAYNALEAAMGELPLLEKVDMCDTGAPYTALDELNKKYESVQVVWRVRFGHNNYYSLRTDDEYFRPSEFGESPPAVTDEDTQILRYCTGLRALDLGHQYFTELSWLEDLPHMTYLIVAECPIKDLTPLTKLKELKYLEIFKTNVSDLSPLAECPNLKALNCCYIKASQANAFNALKKMPQLEYLWYCSSPLTRAQINTLKGQNPNLVTFTLRGGESSGGQWRYNQYYYEMRDVFHAWYMPSGTNGVDPDNPTTQIIIDDAGTKFYLENYDGSQYWWREERYSWMHPYIIGVTTDG